MAQTCSDGLLNSSVDYISLQDILHAFNNCINEEQAWAVCYQCAHYFISNSTQDKFREIYYYGTVAIRLGKDGEILIDVTTYNQGSGKGPPRKRSSFSLSREFKATVSQIDAIQALGSAIYKALDYGLCPTEEPHLATDLEELIEFMTNPEEDDEGIDQCIFQDIIDMCVKHVSDQDNAGQHYKAVCRALVTEAKQLITFLDNIARGQERLSANADEDSDGLDELQRADWARLWVQIMRDLRQGVRLRKVEHVRLTPLEYELTPFEILLEDIRLRRYKLNQIMVNGDIPPKVKNDAHAVILDFIRSRPPLKPVNRRELNRPPQKEMGAREKLLQDIRKPHQLKHVKQGKVVVGARSTPLRLDDVSSDEDSPKPVRKVIKPVEAFQVSDEETEDSSVLSEGTDDEGHHRVSAPVMSPLSPVYPTADPAAWKRAVAKDLVTQDSNCRALTRRHTITVCDMEGGSRKVQQTPSVESVINENEEIPPENFIRGHAARRPTRLVAYRQHGSKVHENCVHDNRHRVHGSDVSRSDSPKMHANVPPRRHSEVFVSKQNQVLGVDDNRSDSPKMHVSVPSRRHSDIFVSNKHRVHDSRKSVCASSSNSVVNPTRSVSPCRNAPRSVSPCKHAGRAQSPVRVLTRSETFTTSIPHNAKNCVRNEPHISTRCDSPQTRQLTRSESFSAPRCDSFSKPVRSESPHRHSVSSFPSCRNTACEGQNVHERCLSPCRKVALSERSASPCGMTRGNRSRSQSPCRHMSHSDNTHVSSNLHTDNKAVPVLRNSRSVQRKPSTSELDNNVNDHSEKTVDGAPSQRHTKYVSVRDYHARQQIKDKNTSDQNHMSQKKTVSASREIDPLSLQESRSEHVQREREVTSVKDKQSNKQRPGIIRARSKPEIAQSGLVVKSDSFETEKRHLVHERPVSELDFRRPYSSRIPRALSQRSRSEKQLLSDPNDQLKGLKTEEGTSVNRTFDTEKDKEKVQTVDHKTGEKSTESKSRKNVEVNPKEEAHWGMIESKPKREVKLSRQSAIKLERKDVKFAQIQNENGKPSMPGVKLAETDSRARKSGSLVEPDSKDQSVEMRLRDGSPVRTKPGSPSDKIKSEKSTEIKEVKLGSRSRVTFNENEFKPSVDESDNSSANRRPVRTIARSKSEVRQRAQASDTPGSLVNTEIKNKPETRSRSENRPVRGLHFLDKADSVNKREETDPVRDRHSLSPIPSPNRELTNNEDSAIEESSSAFGGLTSAIKGLSQLSVTDLLHVSWKSECPRKETNNSSPCSDCRPVPNKWQNPIECLSLTLEEVTHIRMVLTKAELESLVTDPELYSAVSKGKVCFTCKQIKFSFFGQWSTRCKLCQRNVCNYCLRKMNVPTEHFEKIPVYTLSPVPISPEVLEAIKVYESTGSVPHSPTNERKNIEDAIEDKKEEKKDEGQATEDKLTVKRRTLQRSHTIGVGSRPLPNKALLKGPQMSICSDCKAMIMEIIRASRTSASLVNKGKNDPTPSTDTQQSATPQRSSLGVVSMRQKVEDDKPRPRSMLENFSFKSFNISRSTTDA